MLKTGTFCLFFLDVFQIVLLPPRSVCIACSVFQQLPVEGKAGGRFRTQTKALATASGPGQLASPPQRSATHRPLLQLTRLHGRHGVALAHRHPGGVAPRQVGPERLHVRGVAHRQGPGGPKESLCRLTQSIFFAICKLEFAVCCNLAIHVFCPTFCIFMFLDTWKFEES